MLGTPSRRIAISATILLAFGLCPSATAQPSERPVVVKGEGVTITKGLALPGWDYFQSAWRADPLELAIVRDEWSPPSTGDRVDSTRSWQPVVADSTGWIAHPDLRGGYLYSTVESASDRVVILEGLGYRGVLVNGEPRTGNVYGFKEDWQPWEPPFDFSFVPVKLRAGTNHFLFVGGRGQRLKAILHEPETPFLLNARDVTVPDLILGDKADYAASIALINATQTTARGLVITATVEDASPVHTTLPDLPPLSVRKVGFRIQAPAPSGSGERAVQVMIRRPGSDEPVDQATIHVTVKDPRENHRRTFTSSIDGSVQYYGVKPARGEDPPGPHALVLSVHGAAVEAINQSGSYAAKTWAHIVAPTNRRPYGFNWEDWGRLDALEVLDIAESTLDVDPRRIYLTGHSMGGHGTWHLGALFPDRFAAIGPSAGWISFWSYRPRRELGPDSPMRQMLMRANRPSRTMELATNYRDLGIYVIHGADDDNVPAEQSRMMVKHLSAFHHDFVYHEEPDAGHWWDKSDEEGADCVDWPPLFDFFARHQRPAQHEVREIDFVTPDPGVSSCYRWGCILQQIRPFDLGRLHIRFDPSVGRFIGETTNVEWLSLTVPDVRSDSITITVDGQQLQAASAGSRILLRRSRQGWALAGEMPASHKGPRRSGTVKGAFRHGMVMVYGTGGSTDENEWALAKARFDAEQFWYQGNGGVDVIPDTAFAGDQFVERSVILYGNADTNGAWRDLMGDSPVQVFDGRLEVGETSLRGDHLGLLVVRPRHDSELASVAAIAGTGVSGMRITNLRPYLSAGFAYPDVVVFDARRNSESDIVTGAGFFGNDWSVERGEFVWTKD